MNEFREYTSARRMALAVAEMLTLHGRQCRKGSDIPYVSHPLAVASIVMEHGGDEDEQVAALLHDTAEDCGGAPVLNRVGCLFGARVAAIVEGCSDTLVTPKPDWHTRKSRYIARLERAGRSVKLVCAADKLHNLRCTVDDVRRNGPATMRKFNASADHVQWYYAACAAAVADSIPPALRERLQWAQAELELLLVVPQGNA